MHTDLQEILAQISLNPDIDRGDLLSSNKLILSGITQGLKADRASVWLLSDDHSEMHCTYQVDCAEHQQHPGIILTRAQYPRYFSALDEERNIVANDAHQHPQTSEFSTDYLTPLGIHSMLDTPIRHHGVMVGIICIEHRAAKQWQTDDIVFAGFLADIYGRALSASERVRYQQQLEQLNSGLEQIISQRTQELTQSLEQLQHTQHRLIEIEKMASLGRLVAGIAHEINTPLGVAVTANSHAQATLYELEQRFLSGNLTRQHFSQSGNAIKSSIAMVKSNLERAVDLVNSFKQTAGSAAEQRPELLDMVEFLPRVVRSIDSLLQEHDVSVVIKHPERLSIHSFASTLATIISRIIENACYHAFTTANKRQVCLSVSQNAYSWQLSIADNGRGMSPDELDRAFEPFFTTKRNMGAKGLGLTLVFNLVSHVLQGEVSLTNTDSGCMVTITCPLDLATA